MARPAKDRVGIQSAREPDGKGRADCFTAYVRELGDESIRGDAQRGATSGDRQASEWRPNRPSSLEESSIAEISWLVRQTPHPRPWARSLVRAVGPTELKLADAEGGIKNGLTREVVPLRPSQARLRANAWACPRRGAPHPRVSAQSPTQHRALPSFGFSVLDRPAARRSLTAWRPPRRTESLAGGDMWVRGRAFARTGGDAQLGVGVPR